MNTSVDKNSNDALLLTGGLAAISGATSMFIAVALQMATGWFLAEALATGRAGWMPRWLTWLGVAASVIMQFNWKSGRHSSPIAYCVLHKL